MSNKEIAKNLIDQIPDSKLIYVIAYLQGAAIPDETPNTETLEALEEIDEMIQSESGEHFTGSTANFFTMLAEE